MRFCSGLGLGWFRVYLGLHSTWTPKVCRIIAFWAILRGLRQLRYLLLGFSSGSNSAMSTSMVGSEK